jgi:hypothetical protein
MACTTSDREFLVKSRVPTSVVGAEAEEETGFTFLLVTVVGFASVHCQWLLHP